MKLVVRNIRISVFSSIEAINLMESMQSLATVS